MQQIKIDFDNPGLPQHLEAMEGDAQSRFFQATLYRSGAAYTPPADAVYSIMYRGFGEQNQGWYDTIEDDTGKRNACVASGNVVTCEIDRHALIVPGHVSIVLCITNDRGYMLKSRPILTDARNDNYDDTVEVESYFRITGKTSAWWLQNKKDVQALVDMATAEATKAENSANASATSAAASKGSADNSAASASASAGSAAAAARSENAAAGSATEAAGSASAAEESKTAAATSESNAAKHEEAAKKAADEAGAKAGTDKTLSIENAPADAKATGDALDKKANKDVILDEDGNVIFYSKAAVDELLAGKLDLTGGTMTGTLDFSGERNGSILSGEEDAANVPGDPLNNLVIRSWWGVSFTTNCPNQTFTGKTAVGIDCRNGTIKAPRFEGVADNGVVASGVGYVRFGDGTQICWGNGTMPVKRSNDGSFFLQYSGILTVNFPAAFSSNPAGFVNGGDHAAYWNGNSPWTSTTSIRVSIAANGTADSMQYSYIAIGRWK